MISGIGVLAATVSARPAMEKLALRSMSLCMFVYVGWILVVVDWRRSAMTVMLGLMLIWLAEIRVAALKGLYRVAEDWQDATNDND
jgi:hypothetical protein